MQIEKNCAAVGLSILQLIWLLPVSVSAQALSLEGERQIRPKATFKECAACPEMIVVPAGSVKIGSSNNEYPRSSSEGPPHIVIFDRPFAVGKFEVTVDQFGAFVHETGRPVSSCANRAEYSWRNPGFVQTGLHPATCITWVDAMAYVDWLRSKTNRSAYRLLTEAEWEYVARGQATTGSETPYPHGYGGHGICRYGNVNDNTSWKTGYWEKGPPWPRPRPVALGRDAVQQKAAIRSSHFFPCTDGYSWTAPIGRFGPNAFGLHDLQGNVSEWTEDCWNANYEEAPTNGSAWTSGNCHRRVVRGGSFASGPGGVRSASRTSQDSRTSQNDIGLRVARTLDRPR